MLADWHAQQTQQGGGGLVIVRKLWLFDNQLGDDGARQVARMLHPGMLEVSHQMSRAMVGISVMVSSKSSWGQGGLRQGCALHHGMLGFC